MMPGHEAERHGQDAAERRPDRAAMPTWEARRVFDGPYLLSPAHQLYSTAKTNALFSSLLKTRRDLATTRRVLEYGPDSPMNQDVIFSYSWTRSGGADGGVYFGRGWAASVNAYRIK